MIVALDTDVLVSWAMQGAPRHARITPGPAALSRAFDLLEAHHLGRKRILDTVLATTLEQAAVRRIAPDQV